MPLHKHLPLPECEMSEVYPKFTLCQLLRDTYHLTDDPDIRMNLRIATGMAKAIVKKLRKYKKDWDVDFWEDTKKMREVAKP